ncbi:MAG TPA: hypothetical protein VLH19_01170 [Patescibacteria group bacterium]|nr:hypothetical protein [Patescibacteria group bacterium]
MRSPDILGTNWYKFLEENGKVLARESFVLLEREERLGSNLPDYSFIVFPIGKTYEGFIKLYLQRMGILNRPDYVDTRFRIGRALNPDVGERQKDEWWLFDDLERSCGTPVARQLWNAWIECRNHVFHYYIGQATLLNLDEARKKIDQVCSAMEVALQCMNQNK